MDGKQAYVREIALLGEEGWAALRAAHVAVFGIGGVGSFAAEALVRAGVGSLTFVDGDAVAESNLNRQLVALHSTLGQNKAEVMAARARDIDPACRVTAVPAFYRAGEGMDLSAFSCVADCIDAVADKVALLAAARRAGVPAVSCMGAGNRLAADFRVDDVEKTSGCPLARIVRRELKKEGVTGVRAVYSPSAPLSPACGGFAEGERAVGSISFVPSVAGLLAASEVVRILLEAAGVRVPQPPR